MLSFGAFCSTCIKQKLVLKYNFCVFESARFTQVLLYIVSNEGAYADKHTQLQ